MPSPLDYLTPAKPATPLDALPQSSFLRRPQDLSQNISGLAKGKNAASSELIKRAVALLEQAKEADPRVGIVVARALNELKGQGEGGSGPKREEGPFRTPIRTI